MVGLRPEESGELLSSDRPSCQCEVGEEGDGLPRIDGHELTVPFDARGAEEADRQTWGNGGCSVRHVLNDSHRDGSRLDAYHHDMSGGLSHADTRASFPVRLAVYGFALIVLSVVVAIAAGNATGAFAAIPPLVLLVVLALVLLLTGRGLIPGLIVAVLALLAYVVLEVLTGFFQLRHPDSLADFVPAFMRAVGSLLAFYGTMTALRERRRGSLRPAGSRERRVIMVGTGALAAVAVLSAVLTYAGGSDASVPSGALLVVTEDDRFDPSDIEAKPGDSIRVFVRNTDSYAHTFTIDEAGIDEYIGPRSERLVRFRAPRQAGRFELWCAVTGHDEMTGTLLVSD